MHLSPYDNCHLVMCDPVYPLASSLPSPLIIVEGFATSDLGYVTACAHLWIRVRTSTFVYKFHRVSYLVFYQLPLSHHHRIATFTLCHVKIFLLPSSLTPFPAFVLNRRVLSLCYVEGFAISGL